MYHQLPKRFIPDVVQALNVYAQFVITFATAFSGSDILVEALDTLKHARWHHFEIKVTFQQVFMCEIAAHAQRFLKQTNTKCKFLIRSAAELAFPMAVNMISGSSQLVPTVFMMVAGFMCCDKSGNSSKRKDLKAGMQEGRGKTSETFMMIYAYILIHTPYLVILENLREFFTIGDNHVTSDGLYVCAMMKKAGYAIVTFVIAIASDQGSGAERKRV
jgi:hypothetical protein